MKTDRTARAVNIPGDGRIGIVAGNGHLPALVAEAIAAAGSEPILLLVRGEADEALEQYEHRYFALADFRGLIRFAKSSDISSLVLAGGISSRPRARDIRIPLDMLLLLPRFVKTMALGDDGLLRGVIWYLETKKRIRVLGVHDVVPEILVGEGCMTRAKPGEKDWRNVAKGIEAAKALGSLDVGQGAVVVGDRVVALEGAEGTAAMLARVAEMRKNGRIPARDGGVLVKSSKPGQELRADLPAMGPETVEQASLAKLAGIALEANHSIVLDSAATVSRANDLGLFIVGFASDRLA